MPRTASTSSRRSPRPAPARGAKTPLKSPLAVPSGTSAVPVLPADAAGAAGTRAVLSDRGATLAEFEDYLRTVNNRDGRPYEEKTIAELFQDDPV